MGKPYPKPQTRSECDVEKRRKMHSSPAFSQEARRRAAARRARQLLRCGSSGSLGDRGSHLYDPEFERMLQGLKAWRFQVWGFNVHWAAELNETRRMFVAAAR